MADSNYISELNWRAGSRALENENVKITVDSNIAGESDLGVAGLEARGAKEVYNVPAINSIFEELNGRVTSLDEIGSYLGAFDSFLKEPPNTPLSKSDFKGRPVTVNDFITVRKLKPADLAYYNANKPDGASPIEPESENHPVRFVVRGVNKQGVITWEYDVTYSWDEAAVADKMNKFDATPLANGNIVVTVANKDAEVAYSPISVDDIVLKTDVGQASHFVRGLSGWSADSGGLCDHVGAQFSAYNSGLTDPNLAPKAGDLLVDTDSGGAPTGLIGRVSEAAYVISGDTGVWLLDGSIISASGGDVTQTDLDGFVRKSGDVMTGALEMKGRYGAENGGIVFSPKPIGVTMLGAGSVIGENSRFTLYPNRSITFETPSSNGEVTIYYNGTDLSSDRGSLIDGYKFSLDVGTGLHVTQPNTIVVSAMPGNTCRVTVKTAVDATVAVMDNITILSASSDTTYAGSAVSMRLNTCTDYNGLTASGSGFNLHATGGVSGASNVSVRLYGEEGFWFCTGGGLSKGYRFQNGAPIRANLIDMENSGGSTGNFTYDGDTVTSGLVAENIYLSSLRYTKTRLLGVNAGGKIVSVDPATDALLDRTISFEADDTDVTETEIGDEVSLVINGVPAPPRVGDIIYGTVKKYLYRITEVSSAGQSAYAVTADIVSIPGDRWVSHSLTP